MKKVSAATITHLSAAAAYSAAVSASAPPTVEDMMTALNTSHRVQARELAALLTQVPAGFAVVPVLYTRISQQQRAALESEYVFSVRQRFLKFLAQTQQTALSDLGICAHGIARMARGLDPANAQGQRYTVSVDHIIERAGSGKLANARVRDEQRDDAMSQTYAPNHFSNLILLPQDVHDYKNRLNGLQDIYHMSEGDSRWILMLTPVVSAHNPGYVCTPQPVDRTLGQLALHKPTLPQHIGETKTIAVEAIEKMQALTQDTSAGSVLQMLEQLARKNRPSHANLGRSDDPDQQRQLESIYLGAGFTVADLGVVQPRSPHAANNNQRKGAKAHTNVASAPNTLRAIFNAAVSHDPDAQHVIARDLRPSLRELTQLLEETYARALASELRTSGHQNYSDFVQFFRGRNIRRLCIEASRYPLAESRDLLATYRRINREVIQREKIAKQFKSFKKTG